MKKKTNVRTLIRQIVREEVAMAINEVVTELKKPSLSSPKVSQPKQQKRIVEKKQFTENSVLNDILNETAQDSDWKSMGGETYTTDRMNEVMQSSYGDMMSNDSNTGVVVDGQQPDFLKKDYRELLKKSQEKSKAKSGRI